MRAEFYFCVVDPEGIFIHPTLSLNHDDSVKQWIETEQTMNIIANAGRSSRGESRACAPSWEHFESQGFKCLRVKLEVANANNS